MTLAYVFWHEAKPDVDRAAYEQALLDFHARLARHPIQGTIGSRTLRVPATPWLPGGGYEDWYYVEDFTALGLLNDGAIDAAHAVAHDAAASKAGFGTAGLYRLIDGAYDATGAHHVWFPKPDVLPSGTLWQRQLVLGPAPEFCLVCSETGPTETGPTETGPTETGPTETGPTDDRVTAVPVDPVGL